MTAQTDSLEETEDTEQFSHGGWLVGLFTGLLCTAVSWWMSYMTYDGGQTTQLQELEHEELYGPTPLFDQLITLQFVFAGVFTTFATVGTVGIILNARAYLRAYLASKK